MQARSRTVADWKISPRPFNFCVFKRLRGVAAVADFLRFLKIPAYKLHGGIVRYFAGWVAISILGRMLLRQLLP